MQGKTGWVQIIFPRMARVNHPQVRWAKLPNGHWVIARLIAG
jgi:hypothetical protein